MFIKNFHIFSAFFRFHHVRLFYFFFLNFSLKCIRPRFFNNSLDSGEMQCTFVSYNFTLFFLHCYCRSALVWEWNEMKWMHFFLLYLRFKPCHGVCLYHIFLDIFFLYFILKCSMLISVKLRTFGIDGLKLWLPRSLPNISIQLQWYHNV